MLDAPSTGFAAGTHPQHPRLRALALDPARLRAFFARTRSIDVQQLEYVPYLRFTVARHLDDAFGGTLGTFVRETLVDRASGGFTAGVAGVTEAADDFVRFGTAFAHLAGPSNYDAMSQTFYARFLVEHTDASDSFLRQAYRDLTLHTDGTFVDDATDWLLMMKFGEANAAGGESRLLHLDDWESLERLSAHPLAERDLTYKGPPSKNVAQIVKRPTFFDDADGRRCISFIDQFAYPANMDEAAFLDDLCSSLERSPAAIATPLPVGDLVMLNNAFWLHGRAAFGPNAHLRRELMRQRGTFST